MAQTAETELSAPSPAQADVAIVFVAYRAAAVIRDCLPTVMANLDSLSCQVILVDNDSQDGTVEYVREAYPAIQVIEMGWNAGFARANNEAIAAANARHVLLLNTDVKFHGDALGPLVRHLDENPQVAAVSPGMVDGEGRVIAAGREVPRWYTPLEGSVRELLGGKAWALRRLANQRKGRRDQVAQAGHVDGEPVDTDWVPMACTMISGGALARVGKLDPRYFTFFEDVDWCTRARNAGLKVRVIPSVVVTHLVGGGQRRSPRAMRAYVEAEYQYYKDHDGRALGFVRGTLLLRVLGGLPRTLAGLPFDKTRKEELAVRKHLLKGLLTPGWDPAGQ